MSRKAALIDRDGTLNQQPPEHTYVTRVEDFHLLPGAVEGMAKLAGCGHALVVISNQRGIGRGLIPERALRDTEELLRDSLAPHDARIAGFYYCPHLIEDDCDCRKPKPGLLLRAAAELGLDLSASWMIGDSESDVESGAAAGCRTAYLGSDPDVEATIAAGSVPEAATLICAAK